MLELSEFQEEVGIWGNETFNPTGAIDPGDFFEGRINHLEKEIKELKIAFLEPYAWTEYNKNKKNQEIKEEIVDCYLLVLHLVHLRGFDLLDEARKKMEINRGRKWGPPDKNGVIEHTEEK